MNEIKVSGLLLRRPQDQKRELLSWDDYTVIIPRGEQYSVDEDPLPVLVIHPGDETLPYGGEEVFSYGGDDAPFVTVRVVDVDEQIAFLIRGIRRALVLGGARLTAAGIRMSEMAQREVYRLMAANAHLLPLIFDTGPLKGDEAMMINLIIARYGDEWMPRSHIPLSRIHPRWRKPAWRSMGVIIITDE